MKAIANIVAFPTDSESSPFFGALASVLLPALGYTENTPYYCGQRGSFCTHCGRCGDVTDLQKHHLQVYHDYQTLTGVGLGWYWPEDPDTEYQVIQNGGQNWDWPDDFIGYIMDIAGLTWKRLFRDNGRSTLFAEITASIDAGLPVLMELGTGPDWHVATGYDDSGRLYGLDTHTHWDPFVRPSITPDGYTEEGLFVLSDWFDPFVDAIVISGRREPAVKLTDLLEHMIETLARPEHAALKAEIMRRIDRIGPDNAFETARWLNERAGFPIEARWHAASCTDSTLSRLTDNETARQKLFGVTERYVFDSNPDSTHGICWKIWKQLGVGPETGYALTPHSAELVGRPETKAELKRLFSIVFENDRIVLGLLREALAAVQPETGSEHGL